MARIQQDEQEPGEQAREVNDQAEEPEQAATSPLDGHSDEEQNGARYADFDPDDFSGGLPGCLEAMVMSSEEPLTADSMAQVLSRSSEQITEALLALQQEYKEQNRGFELVKSARGWCYMSAAQYEPVVSASLSGGQPNRLSQAALEALAIIAYKQPVTRSQVSSIRGVNSDGVIRSLMLRGFVQELGEEAETRARLLATTDEFLEKIGIDSLEDLPALAPFLPERDEALEGTEDSGAEGAGSDDESGTAFNQFMDRL